MSKSKKADKDTIAELIIDTATGFIAVVDEKVNEAAKETARDTAKTLRSTSPRKTGEYARGWTYKQIAIGKYRVYNRTKPTLAHLLEYGHMGVHRSKDGATTTLRVAAHPHTVPARAEARAEFTAKLKAMKFK